MRWRIGSTSEPSGVAVRDPLALRAGGDGIFVAVDDVQWLDGSSVNALVFALRRMTEPVTRAAAHPPSRRSSQPS